MVKKVRQKEILNIIKDTEIVSQEELQDKLKGRGFLVTQATVSRDINELKISKELSETGISCYTANAKVGNVRYEGIFSQSVIAIDYAGNFVVMKCHSGLANAACAAFDTMKTQNVVGTIAGDDTVFVLTRTEKDAENLCIKLKNLL